MTAERHGVLVVDKPKGPSSHDIVSRARRSLATRAIGHTGTLDPLATGVLVLAVGEGTKLVPYLTADDKEYDAIIALGRSTTSLDLGGEVDGEAPVPPGIDRARVEAAAREFVGAHLQAPPIVSAIKIGGERLYKKARRGEDVEVAPREVRLDRVEVQSVDGERIALSLAVGKGFYVRSFARDLAKALGTLGHLAELRRTRNGAFTLADALDETGLRDPETSRSHVLSLARAWAPRPTARLTAAGVAHARAGRAIALAELASIPDEDQPVALLDEASNFVAIAARHGDHARVIRGFAP